jgi:hypothetical protein
MPMDGTADGTPDNDEGPGCSAGASDLLFLLAPHGIRTRVATLRGRRRVVTETCGLHGVLVTAPRVCTQTR